MIFFLRMLCLFYPTASLGMLSSSVFFWTERGVNAVIVTIFRNLFLMPLLALVFAISFKAGLTGVWLGIVIANIFGSIFAFGWVRFYLKKLVT